MNVQIARGIPSSGFIHHALRWLLLLCEGISTRLYPFQVFLHRLVNRISRSLPLITMFCEACKHYSDRLSHQLAAHRVKKTCVSPSLNTIDQWEVSTMGQHDFTGLPVVHTHSSSARIASITYNTILCLIYLVD